LAGASVALRDVHKRYGETHVVKGVSLSVEPGEFLVLVGPSGCGKSTLLRMIAGLEGITSGDVDIAGRRVNDLPPRDRDIGMVFQSYALYPHMRVRDNLAFGLTLRRAPAALIAERVGEAARILALEPLLSRFPRELSGGQRQRVAIGRAIVREPSVFLFDEPLSNLDAALRVQTRGELAALHRRLKTTMIYVTHDQVEAMTLASRIALLHDGVLQQVGPPLALYERPANRFVAGFIGSPPMSFIPGRLEGRDGQTVVVYLGDGPGDGPGAAPIALPIDLPVDPASGEVTLGLRPQALRLGADGEGLAAEVTVVEPMGAETFIHARLTGPEPCPVVVHHAGSLGADLPPGAMVRVVLDPSRAHVFDTATGAALHHGASA